MNKLWFLSLIVLQMLFFNGCTKEPVTESTTIDSLVNESDSGNLKSDGQDKTTALYFQKSFESPKGVTDNFDLFLLPRLDFKEQMHALHQQGDEDALFDAFTGIIKGSKEGETHFAAYYQAGNYVGDVEDELRVGEECWEIWMTTETTTDWFQIVEADGITTITYLGSTTETNTELIGYDCLPGGFDQFYTGLVVNEVFMNQTQTQIWMLDKWIEEGVQLVDFCNSDNDSNNEILEAVIDFANIEVLTEEAFWEGYVEMLEDCLGISFKCKETEGEELLECIDAELALAESGFLNSHTCKSSFNFVSVGAGYTTQVNEILHAYKQIGFPFMQYRIPEMCVQVNGQDSYGNPLTADKAAELAAYATDNARIAVFDDIGLSVFSGLDAKLAFKAHFVSELSELTGGNATSSVSYGACFGNIPEQNYTITPLGILPCVHAY
ncbi:MAG: hypothetical protein DWQ02_06835 [Bacteroidetes bacterium]|nr:MAG: hypothetical protein DWQ02_06835 [Bacteroidota bacterium]